MLFVVKKLTFVKNRELHHFDNIWKSYFKVNKIIKKNLLNGHKFKPELHLKQPGFIYSACGPFTEHCKRIQKFR